MGDFRRWHAEILSSSLCSPTLLYPSGTSIIPDSNTLCVGLTSNRSLESNMAKDSTLGGKTGSPRLENMPKPTIEEDEDKENDEEYWRRIEEQEGEEYTGRTEDDAASGEKSEKGEE
ncbi:hypothetical protein E4T56_gene9284 [Termitomyces sp. T112]|nr:hypothetical protein E4T56_gene9284 [Termitomyces sp. T112]